MSRRSHSIAMSNSRLIPGILDPIVKEEIIPRLPWHTRPLIIALSRFLWNALEPIGDNVDTATLTRLKHPLKCRLAVDYCHTFRDRTNAYSSSTIYGYVVKIYDGQWRNVPPIMGRGPYTYTFDMGEHNILQVVDGTLYFSEQTVGPNLQYTLKINALDVGSGLWKWKAVYKNTNYSDSMLYICRSGRVAGGLVLYRAFPVSPHLQSFEITEIPPQGPVIPNTKRHQHLDRFTIVSSQQKFLHMGNRLYLFGAETLNRENVWSFDLNTKAWHSSRPESEFMGSLNVQKEVLLVTYSGESFYILRYDPSNERWTRAGRIFVPDDPVLRWTWCVEYDGQGEKQLWIYICRKDYNVCKFQVVERLGRRTSIRKAWDDIELLDGEVECELDAHCKQLDESFQPVEPFDGNGNAPSMLLVRSFHGFHRGDTTNFEDLPRHV